MANCRSCDAKIDFVKNSKGKFLPVNAEYIKYDEAEPGTVLVTDGGNVYTKKEGDSMPNVKGRESHFATCPQADTWRKK